MSYQYFVVAYSLLDVLDACLFTRRQRVIALAAGNIKQEVAHHRFPIVGKIDLRVELNSVNLQRTVPHSWKKFTVHMQDLSLTESLKHIA